ncbi:hypothetical protein BDN70DRAFT_885648 [Pholiota conissans]|uniref:Uncharacterized protein n=1 Tax=Pholiota conissans TaxID=109636 RepID=A0A9P6CVJ6_9AGAR|nr:hypothetical protein BDN70DRAFT_885648 [Pholiota conissans]
MDRRAAVAHLDIEPYCPSLSADNCYKRQPRSIPPPTSASLSSSFSSSSPSSSLNSSVSSNEGFHPYDPTTGKFENVNARPVPSKSRKGIYAKSVVKRSVKSSERDMSSI